MNTTTETRTTADTAAIDNETVWNMIATERRALANDLTGLTEADFDAASDLNGWSAKHVLGHVVTPFKVSTLKYVATLLRYFGNLDKTNNKYADAHLADTAADLVELLRDNAENRWAPPGEGPEMPLTETVVHAQDLRRALGIPYTVPAATAAVIINHAKTDKKQEPELAADYANRIASI